MSSLHVGKVMKVHPEAHAVDVVLLHNSARIPMVQMIGHGASSNTGLIDMPEPTPAGDNPIAATNDRDQYAIVGYIGRTPVVLGFLHPQVSQNLFKGRKNFRLNRHASDVYSSLNDGGDFEMHWPNGTYLRVGEDPEHEDLAGQDFDGKFALARNADKALHVRLVVKSGGAQTAMFNIDPDGKLTGQVSEIDLTVTGNITSEAAQWNHTGPMQVDGTLHVTDDVTVDKTLTATTDVVGGGKHLKTHTHGSVQSGSSHTSAPD